MNFRNKSKVENLSEWLAIATKGLVPAAKERIAQEIETHYAEAVEARLSQGKQEQIAKVSALAELGDPKVAGKRFRKKHLTEKEAWRLGQSEKAVSTKAFLPINYVGSMFIYFHSHPIVR